MADIIYDVESFLNIFSVVFADTEKKEIRIFEISDRKNDEKKLRNYCKKMYLNKDRMVGFNNIGYDYPLLHFILKNKGLSAEDIYEKTEELIEGMRGENKFAGRIRPSEIMIPQLDLYLINHFNNKARATSLKMIEFNSRSKNIEDLPFPVGSFLIDDQKDVLIKYNQHDVLETLKFYNECLPAIEFREKLSKKYKKNMMNFDDTKIGKEYFVMQLEEENPGCCYKPLPRGGRKINQTVRESIDIGECIFDYVEFDRPEFNALKDWFSKQVITETKGVFTDIEEHLLGDVAQYAELRTKQKKVTTDKQIEKLKKEHPMGWVEDRELKSGKISKYFCWRVAECLNVVVDGFRYDFGTGGAHGAIENSIYKTDDNYIVRDEDVTSYYPSLSIKNRIYPEHLSEKFCDIYEEIFEERKRHKRGTAENDVMKLALNGSYGASNDKYSPLYDPKFTMGITVNGQLSLCMLAEKLVSVGAKIIMVNTDGLTYYCNKSIFDETQKVCREWEQITKLQLEGATYEKMIMADVNSYIAIGENGKVKTKGRYVYEGLGWHQNQSMLVVKKAAYYALVEGGSIEHFIRNHKDKFDFCGRTKVPRSSRLVTVDEDGEETPEQNICRYYVANEGKHLVKIMPPLEKDVYGIGLKNPETGEEVVCKNKTEQNKAKRQGFTEELGEKLLPKEERRIGVEAGWKVKTCNNMDDFDWDINYDYYIQEARKLVDIFNQDA